jgi:hypothetical protein
LGARFASGHGAKGERLYDWALLPWAEREGWQHALLARRSLETKPEYAFYFTFAPKKKSTLKAPAAVAGRRWAVESAFEMAKRNAAWTTTKSGTGRAGTGTSPYRCWPWRS